MLTGFADDLNFNTAIDLAARHRPHLAPPFAKGNKLGAIKAGCPQKAPKHKSNSYFAKKFRELAKDYVNGEYFWNILRVQAEAGCVKTQQLIVHYGIGKPEEHHVHHIDPNDTEDVLRTRINALQRRLTLLPRANALPLEIVVPKDADGKTCG